jgi:hypothetical protein
MNSEQKLAKAASELELAIDYDENWRITDAIKLIYEAAKEDAIAEMCAIQGKQKQPEKEISLVNVYVDREGELNLGVHYGNRVMSQASISDLQRQPEWVRHRIPMNQYMIVREGVVKRFCEDDGAVVFVDGRI